MFGVICIFGLGGVLSVLWGVFSYFHLAETYDSQRVATLSSTDLSYVLFATALPILILLVIAAIFATVYLLRQNTRALEENLRSSRLGNATLEVISKSLIEAKKIGQGEEFIRTIPFIETDLANGLEGIIRQANLAGDVALFDSLGKNGGDRLQILSKLVLEKRDSTLHFEETLRRSIKKNTILAASTEIFTEKFAALLKSIEKYDIERILYKVFAEGDIGKVVNLLEKALDSAPDSDKPSLTIVK